MFQCNDRINAHCTPRRYHTAERRSEDEHGGCGPDSVGEFDAITGWGTGCPRESLLLERQLRDAGLDGYGGGMLLCVLLALLSVGTIILVTWSADAIHPWLG